MKMEKRKPKWKLDMKTIEIKKEDIRRAIKEADGNPVALSCLRSLIGNDVMEDAMQNEFKPVLDACCGGRMFYFNKYDNRVLFQDIRDFDTILCDGRTFSVHPDVCASFTEMPYPDNCFAMVVFDPPHLLRNVGKSKFADMYGSLNPKASPSGYQHIKYGALPNRDWRDMLKRGFAECFRVLKSGGFLIFKWNDTDIKTTEILKLTPEEPIFGHLSGKRSNTHWICFMKGNKQFPSSN